MGRLRRRMEEELTLRGYSEKTMKVYLSGVGNFARFFGRSPDELGEPEIRRYLFHLAHERNLAWASINNAVCSIRFFYTRVLGRKIDLGKIPFQKTRKKLPLVMSGGEVEKLFTAACDIRDKALLMCMYAGGLRVGEACMLRLGDIDSARMMIHVRSGKGLKGRAVMLSPKLLGTLRKYWRARRPKSWLFPGKRAGRPITVRAAQEIFFRVRKRAGITRAATCHTLRHSFATHLMETGTNLRYIQELLGHKSPTTTAIYTRVSRKDAAEITSPLDRLKLIEEAPFG